MSKLLNLHSGKLEEIPLKMSIKEGYLNSGSYFKYSSDISFGEENGAYWWSLAPSCGRFEYRFEEGTLTIMKGFSVLVEFLPLEKYKYRYEGHGFEFITDLLTWIYLNNEHDFSEKDMAYVFGKRKYSNTLVKL